MGDIKHIVADKDANFIEPNKAKVANAIKHVRNITEGYSF